MIFRRNVLEVSFVEIRQLKYFLEIVETGSFTRAAASIHIVQPALSRQIRSLEEELGTTLLIRHGRGVVVTEAGERFKERAEALLSQINRLPEEISSEGMEPSGELNIGMPSSLRPMLTPQLISKFGNRYPGVFIRVAEGISAAILDGVNSGKFDLGCVISLEDAGDLECQPLLTQPMYLVGPEGSGFQMNKPVSVRKAASYPLIVMGHPNGLRLVSENIISKAKLVPRVVLELNSIELLYDLIRTGMGFSFVPQSCVFDMLKSGNLEATPIDGMNISWILVTSSKRYQPIAVKRLITMLKEEIVTELESGRWEGSIIDF